MTDIDPVNIHDEKMEVDQIVANTSKHQSREEVEKILDQRFFGGEVSVVSHQICTNFQL